MSKKLTLPLKKKWFDMIKSGEKKEEYREITEYWIRRLTMYWIRRLTIDYYEAQFNYKGNIRFKDFDEVEFTLGYPKKDDKERRMKFSNPQIFVGKGKEEWGAEKDKLYFVIKWEE